MTAFLTWLASTKAGRITAVTMAAIAAFFIALAQAFSSGKASEKTKQDKSTLEAYRSREKIDDETNKLGHADLDREYDRWMRKSDNS